MNKIIPVEKDLYIQELKLGMKRAYNLDENLPYYEVFRMVKDRSGIDIHVRQLNGEQIDYVKNMLKAEWKTVKSGFQVGQWIFKKDE